MTEYAEYKVTITFKSRTYPVPSEASYVYARSKSDANKAVRKQMRDNGHDRHDLPFTLKAEKV